jgi:hypothetical protein
MTDVAIANKPMEGGGFYNRNSDFQAAGIERALPLFEAAARTVLADGPAHSPLVIADYGASQGRNSMKPMGLAIDVLRDRLGAGRPIEVIHTDLPGNDFASLFTTLQDGGSSYLTGRPGVFPSAVGRSYFEPILPAGRVHLGWNTWTLHWLSRSPVEPTDHTMAVFSAAPGAAEAVRRQAAQDWASFLAARSAEMAPGAKLLTLAIGALPDEHGWKWPSTALWEAASQMADEGLVSQGELTRLTIPVYGRTVADLEAPFAGGAYFGLTLEHVEVVEGPDPFWETFQETGDADQLGRQWAAMLRAVSSQIVAEAFAARPQRDALIDDLFARLARRMAATPQRHRQFMCLAVVRREAD